MEFRKAPRKTMPVPGTFTPPLRRKPLLTSLAAAGLAAAAGLTLYLYAPAQNGGGLGLIPSAGAVPAVTVQGPASALRQYLNELGYRLDDIRAGRGAVPRLHLADMPEDMDAVQDVDARKRLFLRLMLPLALHANERVAAERASLLALAGRMRSGETLTEAEQDWLNGLAERYETDPRDLDGLIRRVDAVPPSLVLGQAALESGWGTSRFAREGNALFGQRVFGAAGKGLDPLDAGEGPVFRVRSFETPQESVDAYLHNLNTHPAYAEFRALRARMAKAGTGPDSLALARTLHAYSEEGTDYIRLLTQIIRINRLTALDRAAITAAPPRA